MLINYMINKKNDIKKNIYIYKKKINVHKKFKSFYKYIFTE